MQLRDLINSGLKPIALGGSDDTFAFSLEWRKGKREEGEEPVSKHRIHLLENERTNEGRNTEPVSRHQKSRARTRAGKMYLPCSADHKQGLQSYSSTQLMPNPLNVMTTHTHTKYPKWRQNPLQTQIPGK